MKTTVWKPYLLFVLLAEAVGALAGFLTKDAMASYDVLLKSSLTPPDIVFPVVWVILYALMGIGAARVYLAPPSAARTRSLWLFAAQLAVNFFWSLLFFNRQAFGLAFIWLVLLWVLVLAMVLSFAKTDRRAALLQIPYLLWVTFAGYLNFAVWQLNR